MLQAPVAASGATVQDTGPRTTESCCLPPQRGGHWGLRYCGIGQFFMRYFGNFNFKLRYCGILQTCGMRFLYVLVDDIQYKNVSFTFFRPFIAVSGRFGSTLKRSYFVTHFNLQCDCSNNPFKPCHCFHGPTARFCLYFCSRVKESTSYTGLL